MNKVLPAIIAFCLSLSIAYSADVARDFSSTDEVILVPEETPVQEAGVEENQTEEKTLIEKLKAIREAEYYNYDQKDFLLREVFTHEFPEESKLDYLISSASLLPGLTRGPILRYLKSLRPEDTGEQESILDILD